MSFIVCLDYTKRHEGLVDIPIRKAHHVNHVNIKFLATK